MEIKMLIVKIANPTSNNEKDEHVDQYTHMLEDILNELYKIKK